RPERLRRIQRYRSRWGSGLPREVVKGALLTNAVSVILVHNHPSGDLNPSENDIVVSASIAQACQTVDVELFDHVIIGKDDYYSFAENGDL
ncbi:MAG: JAB domain-containing protein, partial [Nitrospirota bacterium]